LSCYHCNSFKDPDCSGTSLDKFKAACPANSVGCRKIQYKMELPGTSSVEERIVRQCSKSRRDADCISVYGTNGKRYKQFTCECNGDYCNQSTRSRPLALLVCVIAMVTLFMLV
ncbi:unnamed protein product, partial [Candidula unifasciata]